MDRVAMASHIGEPVIFSNPMPTAAITRPKTAAASSARMATSVGSRPSLKYLTGVTPAAAVPAPLGAGADPACEKSVEDLKAALDADTAALAQAGSAGGAGQARGAGQAGGASSRRAAARGR